MLSHVHYFSSNSILNNFEKQKFIHLFTFYKHWKIALHCEELSKIKGSGKSSNLIISLPFLMLFTNPYTFLISIRVEKSTNIVIAYQEIGVPARGEGDIFSLLFWSFLQTHTPFLHISLIGYSICNDKCCLKFRVLASERSHFFSPTQLQSTSKNKIHTPFYIL